MSKSFPSERKWSCETPFSLVQLVSVIHLSANIKFSHWWQHNPWMFLGMASILAQSQPVKRWLTLCSGFRKMMSDAFQHGSILGWVTRVMLLLPSLWKRRLVFGHCRQDGVCVCVCVFVWHYNNPTGTLTQTWTSSARRKSSIILVNFWHLSWYVTSYIHLCQNYRKTGFLRIEAETVKCITLSERVTYFYVL